MEDLPKHYDSCKNFEESLKKYQEAKEKYDAFIKSLPIIVNENNTQEIADQRELLHEELNITVDEIQYLIGWIFRNYTDLLSAHEFILITRYGKSEYLYPDDEYVDEQKQPPSFFEDYTD